MIIIKQGKGNPKPMKWTGQFTCPNCLSILEVEEEDLDGINTNNMRGGVFAEGVTLDCPSCEWEISLWNYEVPPSHRNLAR